MSTRRFLYACTIQAPSTDNGSIKVWAPTRKSCRKRVVEICEERDLTDPRTEPYRVEYALTPGGVAAILNNQTDSR